LRDELKTLLNKRFKRLDQSSFGGDGSEDWLDFGVPTT